MSEDNFIANLNETLLITGASGFIGSRVVEVLLRYGFRDLRCFVRPSSNLDVLNGIIESYKDARITILAGNLMSREACERATRDVSVIYHLAAGTSGKSFASTYMNSVVTTRNLLDTTLKSKSMKRFLNVSSFTVYDNMRLKRGALLDETCEIEKHPENRGEAYCFGKVKQEELLQEYSKEYNIPFVIMRPGVVYGPGNQSISGRVGIDTFGIFLHMGGSNRIPLTYVDNCAEAIVLGGLVKNIDGEIFNIVDDELPKSRQFLKFYKKNVGYFKSIYVPKLLSYFFSYLWEKYSEWSRGQLPPAFNRKRWSSDWKGNCYSNEKLKKLLGWKPRVSFEEGSRRYFAYCKKMRNINA